MDEAQVWTQRKANLSTQRWLYFLVVRLGLNINDDNNQVNARSFSNLNSTNCFCFGKFKYKFSYKQQWL